MPYVRRNLSGLIDSLHRQPQDRGDEFLADNHPDVQAFVGNQIMISIITAIAIILGTILAYFMAARITKPIILIKENLHRAAKR